LQTENWKSALPRRRVCCALPGLGWRPVTQPLFRTEREWFRFLSFRCCKWRRDGSRRTIETGGCRVGVGDDRTQHQQPHTTQCLLGRRPESRTCSSKRREKRTTEGVTHLLPYAQCSALSAKELVTNIQLHALQCHSAGRGHDRELWECQKSQESQESQESR
jgi:hypothetical protein